MRRVHLFLILDLFQRSLAGFLQARNVAFDRTIDVLEIYTQIVVNQDISEPSQSSIRAMQRRMCPK